MRQFILLLAMVLIWQDAVAQAIVIQREDGKRIDTLRANDWVVVQTKAEHSLGFLGTIPRVRRTGVRDTSDLSAETYYTVKNIYKIYSDSTLKFFLTSNDSFDVEFDHQVAKASMYVNNKKSKLFSMKVKYEKSNPATAFADDPLQIAAITSESIRFIQYSFLDSTTSVTSIPLSDIYRFAFHKVWKKMTPQVRKPDRTSVTSVGVGINGMFVMVPLQPIQKEYSPDWYQLIAVLPQD